MRATSNLDSLLDRLAQIQLEGISSFPLAANISALETASLINQCPQLIMEVPQFPYLYRFLRASELNHTISRGGNTLLIGSGTTIPEFLALYKAPPGKEEIKAVTVGELDFKKKYNEKPKYGRSNFGEFLLEGKAVAVEPNKDDLQDMAEINKVMGVPANRIKVYPYSIADVTEAGELPLGVDTVLWHRADPLVAASFRAQTFEDKYLEELLLSFKNSLVKGGKMIISIGGGMDMLQFELRKKFIAKVKEIAVRRGMLIKVDLSKLLEEPIYKSLFGDSAAGMVGGLILEKHTA